MIFQQMLLGRAKFFFSNVVVIVALVVQSQPAHADLLDNDAGFVAPTIIDFDGLAPQLNVAGPVQVGTFVGEDVTFSGLPNSGLFLNNPTWGLSGNGSWGNGQTFVGGNSARPGSLLFQFNDGPVASVGGFINHAPDLGSDLIVRVYDASFSLIEEHNVTALADISTPGQVNGGGFRGISTGVNNIEYFAVEGYVPVLDTLTFERATSSVPEPGSVTLIGAVAVGLVVRRRR